MFKVTDLPPAIIAEVEKDNNLSAEGRQYSENMIVYTGRKGLHIYDIDRENWIFNTSVDDYKYERIYYQLNPMQASDEEDQDLVSDTDADDEDLVDFDMPDLDVQPPLPGVIQAQANVQTMLNNAVKDNEVMAESSGTSDTDRHSQEEQKQHEDEEPSQRSAIAQIFREVMQRIQIQIKQMLLVKKQMFGISIIETYDIDHEFSNFEQYEMDKL